jgi:AcrR family transcriptional regulator
MSELIQDILDTGDTDRRTEKGRTTQQTILARAVDLASREGLEGISIGRLASDLHMSKSGLIAHFGSKEALQLATIETACTIYNSEIVQPALLRPRGLDRLRDLCDRWLTYHAADMLSGGCFFLAVSSEFDSREGPVRHRIKHTMSQWLRLLKRELYSASKNREISQRTDITQIAFEINSIGHGANWAYQLYGDRSVFEKARVAIGAILDRLKK